MASSKPSKDAPSPDQLPSLEELVEVLAQSVEEVFEAMLITITSRLEELDVPHDCVDEGMGQKEEGVDLEVEVTFSGALGGAVVLRCNHQGAEDIARGLLMMEEGELEFEEIKDALGECANLITGSMKSKALDPIADFSMGTPHVREASQDSRSKSHLAFELSSGVMSAELWIDDCEAQAA